MAEEENKEAEGEEIVVKKSGNSQVMIMMVLCIAVILLTPFAVIYTLRVFDGAEQADVSSAIETKQPTDVINAFEQISKNWNTYQ